MLVLMNSFVHGFGIWFCKFHSAFCARYHFAFTVLCGIPNSHKTIYWVKIKVVKIVRGNCPFFITFTPHFHKKNALAFIHSPSRSSHYNTNLVCFLRRFKQIHTIDIFLVPFSAYMIHSMKTIIVRTFGNIIRNVLEYIRNTLL